VSSSGHEMDLERELGGGAPMADGGSLAAVCAPVRRALVVAL
jgi:hypothetical protein